MVLVLKEGKSWAGASTDRSASGEPVAVYVTKVDTGAGEVVMKEDGTMIANVFADPEGAVCDDSCEWALDGVCDDGSNSAAGSGGGGRGGGEGEGSSARQGDDDYGGFYAYDDDYYGGYGYYYEDDDDFLAPVCEEGTDCTDCASDAEEVEPTECSNICKWANDGYCDDTRTSGLCELGTDCHDCGPAGAGNFSVVSDDDGWWDDDENYWDDDYDFESYEPTDDEPHVAFIKSTPNPRTRKKDMYEDKGVGGMFMMQPPAFNRQYRLSNATVGV